jgi:hypothetical protein
MQGSSMQRVLLAAELQKPKRPARNVYAAEANKSAAIGEHAPMPTKYRNKRPDKNTGSTPVLGRDSEEPQLAFRREHGSRAAFVELAALVLDDTAEHKAPAERAAATVQEKNLVRPPYALAERMHLASRTV